mmetsp:Transcript_15480/g.45276  ORF Transcript_15480/g.45276 Transcript_15480/m.45276 type:complete len:340 (-) Transcript_15480:232-1251(-)
MAGCVQSKGHSLGVEPCRLTFSHERRPWLPWARVESISPLNVTWRPYQGVPPARAHVHTGRAKVRVLRLRQSRDRAQWPFCGIRSRNGVEGPAPRFIRSPLNTAEGCAGHEAIRRDVPGAVDVLEVGAREVVAALDEKFATEDGDGCTHIEIALSLDCEAAVWARHAAASQEHAPAAVSILICSALAASMRVHWQVDLQEIVREVVEEGRLRLPGAVLVNCVEVEQAVETEDEGGRVHAASRARFSRGQPRHLPENAVSHDPSLAVRTWRRLAYLGPSVNGVTPRARRAVSKGWARRCPHANVPAVARDNITFSSSIHERRPFILEQACFDRRWKVGPL